MLEDTFTVFSLQLTLLSCLCLEHKAESGLMFPVGLQVCLTHSRTGLSSLSAACLSCYLGVLLAAADGLFWVKEHKEPPSDTSTEQLGHDEVNSLSVKT